MNLFIQLGCQLLSDHLHKSNASGKIASIKCNGIITYFIAIIIFKIHQPTCYFNDIVRYVYKYMFVFHLYEIIDLNSVSYVKGNL